MESLQLIKLQDGSDSQLFTFFYTDADSEAVSSAINLIKSKEDQDDDYERIKQALEVAGYQVEPLLYKTFQA